jgi:hypothetical protein
MSETENRAHYGSSSQLRISSEGGGEFDGVSDMDKFEMPQYISDQDNEELYVTQLSKKLPQGFIQFLDQFVFKSLDQTINLNYYNTGFDEKQAQEQKKILQIAKGLIARLDAYKHAKSVKKIQNETTPTGNRSRLMSKEITIMHFFSDKKVCEIPIPNTKENNDIFATVVVPLICWETNADSIKWEIQTRGKIKKKISIIKTTLQAGSAYMVRWMNHYSMNPSSESSKPCCFKANTTNCALHCATHQLHLNIQQYMRVLVILYI